ncbi:MAG: hypothetical protein Kow0032_28690 [Methyloligellaceae bacterium]
MTDSVSPRLADDLLKGVPEIARYTGDSERRVYHLAERGLIPAFKIGAKWHARKSQLDRFYGGDRTAAA